MNSGPNSDSYESVTSARKNFPRVPVTDFPATETDSSSGETTSLQFKNKYEAKEVFFRETETINLNFASKHN